MAAPHTEQGWLDAIRAAILQGDRRTAEVLLMHALSAFPRSRELLRVRAGLLAHAGRSAEAAEAYAALLEEDPADATSALELARIHADASRVAAAAGCLRACFAKSQNASDSGLAIAAIELLDNGDRKADAAAIADAALAANPGDARLHAYAGMLKVQLGEFDEARRHYLTALGLDARAWEWHVPIGLSSAHRYRDAQHPDFALFHDGLGHAGLSDLARAELHFALAKAHDDIGDCATAAQHLRTGNVIRHGLKPWPRKAWRRLVDARLSMHTSAESAQATPGFAPVFIVGMPRSGTTLLAELLARHPRVCNRGELPWIAQLAQRPELSGRPALAALQAAASDYARRARRDDAGDADWFIDKQPLNFRYVDLALALFPDARIVHCRRSARDTALSLWMQCFLEDVQAYSYDFDDIAQVMRDCDRLMAHWTRQFPQAIRTVQYEQLVTAADDVADTLAHWIGIPARQTARNAPTGAASSIATASLWQARQPVTTRSVGRWRGYASCVPELLHFAE